MIGTKCKCFGISNIGYRNRFNKYRSFPMIKITQSMQNLKLDPKYNIIPIQLLIISDQIVSNNGQRYIKVRPLREDTLYSSSRKRHSISYYFYNRIRPLRWV